MILMNHAMMGAAGYQAQSSGFSVLDYSPGIWLDASDEASITTVSGDVSAISDLSGNNRDLSQGSSAARPAYDQANDCIVFSGGDHLFMTSAPFYANGACVVFGLIEPIIIKRDERWISEGSTTNSDTLYCLNQSSPSAATSSGTFIRSNTKIEIVAHEDLVFANGYETDVPQINYFEDSGGQIRLGKDGSLSSPHSYSRSSTLTLDRFNLGGILRSTFCCDMNFKFYELIILMSVPTESEREEIEGYLAHKWGTTASLPLDHPYKSSAP